MKEQIESTGYPSGRGKRKVLPALCSLAGTWILVSVIAVFLPISVPRLMGYEIYEVVSGSMEPEIPVGSLLYVTATEPENIKEGDVIAFVRGDSVITHRVEENRYVEGLFITKGDANVQEDMVPADYDSLVGRVVYHIPVLGMIMTMVSGTAGKIYALLFALCGMMFHMLAGRLRK